MDVILEENEFSQANNIQSIKIDASNNNSNRKRETSVITGVITNSAKVECLVIDFKKKNKNLSILDTKVDK